MRSTIVALLFLGLAGCSTLQQKLAKRVSCDPAKLVVKEKINAPAFNQYKFTCDGRSYVCKDAPFYSKCEEDSSSPNKPK